MGAKARRVGSPPRCSPPVGNASVRIAKSAPSGGRASDSAASQKDACTVEVVGFPEGTMAGEIRDYLKTHFPKDTYGYVEAYTKGYRTRKGFVVFASFDDKKSFLKPTKEDHEDRSKFTMPRANDDE